MAKAETNYTNKLVSVSGIVGSIDKNFDDSYVIEFKIDKKFDTKVKAVFKDDKGISDLSKGDTVTIVGICEGFTYEGVELTDCKIVSEEKVPEETETDPEETEPEEAAEPEETN